MAKDNIKRFPNLWNYCNGSKYQKSQNLEDLQKYTTTLSITVDGNGMLLDYV